MDHKLSWADVNLQHIHYCPGICCCLLEFGRFVSRNILISSSKEPSSSPRDTFSLGFYVIWTTWRCWESWSISTRRISSWMCCCCMAQLRPKLSPGCCACHTPAAGGAAIFCSWVWQRQGIFSSPMAAISSHSSQCLDGIRLLTPLALQTPLQQVLPKWKTQILPACFPNVFPNTLVVLPLSSTPALLCLSQV